MAARVLKRIRFADDFKSRVHRECRVTPMDRAIECCECHKCRMRRRVAITWRFNLEAAISDCFMLRLSSSRSFYRNMRVNVDFRESVFPIDSDFQETAATKPAEMSALDATDH